MREWSREPLVNVAEIRPSNVDKKSGPGELPVRLCNYMDVYTRDYITQDIQFMDATATAAEIQRFRVERGDVLITKDSETPDDIGISAAVRDEIDDLVCGYHVALLKPNRERVDSIYLAKQLASSETARYFGRLANGSTRYGLSYGSIAATPIRLAPLDQQRRIAEILTTLDESIEQTGDLIAKTQQIKAGLIHDLFTRGVTRNGEYRPPRSGAPQLYKESPLGWIPNEWDVATLGAISDFVTSGSRGWAAYYTEEGPLFIRIGNLTREHPNLRLEDLVHVQPPVSSDGQRTRLAEGDVLISITADLGIVGVIIPSLGEAYVNQHIALVRPKANLAAGRWLGHWLGGPQAQARIRRLDDPGAKAGLNLPTIRALLVALPPKDERDEVVGRLDAADETIQSERTWARKFKLLKAGLMHDLLTGRVRVPMTDCEEIIAHV
jgi:type I restriction enzyme S subunit